MASISVVRYNPRSSQARSTLVNKLLNHSRTIAADISQYVICTPRDAGEDRPILSITSSRTRTEPNTDANMREVIEEIKSEGLLAGPPEIHQLDPVLGFGKEALKTTDLERAMVLFAFAEMHPGAWDICMPAIRNVSDFCEREEPGTLAYSICKAKDDGDAKGYVVEVYESMEYFQDPHMNAQPVQEVLKVVGEHGDYKEFFKMEILGGFLAR